MSNEELSPARFVEVKPNTASKEVFMRFTFLMIALLLFAPVIAGCEGEKKRDPATESKADQDKKKNPRGLTAPPIPDAPP